MQFTIRNYRPNDFVTLLAIDQSCFEPGIAYTAFELKTYILRRNAFTLVAAARKTQPDPAILGFVVGEQLREAGHIITIDVRAESRRHGVGSALLRSAEGELRYRKCTVVRLETAVNNSTALLFYKRHGFTTVNTIPRYYSNGVDALVLEKDLLSPLSPANLLE